MGQMARDPLPDALVRRWTEPALTDAGCRRDLRGYAAQHFDDGSLVRDTEALSGFAGDVLVLWSPDSTVMPPDHGRRLAALIPRATYAEVPGAFVLSMLDEPEAVAREIGDFLTSTGAAGTPRLEVWAGRRRTRAPRSCRGR